MLKQLGYSFGLAAMLMASSASAQGVMNEEGTITLLPQAQALSDEGARRGAAFDEIEAFYAERAFLPLWINSPERREALLDAMVAGEDHGLPTEVYPVDALEQLLATAQDDAGRATVEAAFSDAYVTYARHLNSGVLTPNDVHSELLTTPDVKSADVLLQGLSRADDAATYLASLAPSNKQYRDLVAEKRRLDARIAGERMIDRIPTRGMMRPGYVGDRVVQVRQRLEVLGYGNLGVSTTYDDDLIEVVRRFQEDHKLKPDAVMGPATLGAMNKSASDRLEQVLVNLERQRWMNFDRGSRHIAVNLADFSMAVIDNEQVTFTSNVVIGKTGRDFRTPEFSKDMTHLIVNPFWHVPRSIAGREYLPMLKRDPLALRKRGLLLMNRRGQVLNTAGADFSGYSAGNFPFFIKQPPGNSNALGRVKFMFPNRNNIYLHDTPAKKLFRKDRRAYSHGCIRVERPFELAYHLMAAQESDPEGVFNYLLKKGKERQVNLDQAVPVHLNYNTVFTAQDGTIAYREDVYGRDRIVFDALLDAGVKVDGLSG